MRDKRVLLCGLFGVSLLLLNAAAPWQADAAWIAVTNPSFESPDASGGPVSGIPPGWEGSGAVGVFRSPGFGQGASPSDGLQIAWFNVGNAILRQTLTDTYAANTDYALTVDVSPRVPASLGYTLDLVLYAGNDQSNEVKRQEFSYTVTDLFQPTTMTATAADVTAASAVGQSIRIAFENNVGSEVGNTDFDIDNVSLQAIPEPSTLALSAVGLLSLGLVGWRRRRR
jgi:hypothetical protein